LNSKLHAVCDGIGRPVEILLTEGHVSYHKGATLLLARLPNARNLINDHGYDSNGCQQSLGRALDPALHPVDQEPQIADPTLQALISAAGQVSKHIRALEELAPYRHVIRSLRPHFLLSHLPCQNRHLLATASSPDLSIRDDRLWLDARPMKRIMTCRRQLGQGLNLGPDSRQQRRQNSRVTTTGYSLSSRKTVRTDGLTSYHRGQNRILISLLLRQDDSNCQRHLVRQDDRHEHTGLVGPRSVPTVRRAGTVRRGGNRPISQPHSKTSPFGKFQLLEP